MLTGYARLRFSMKLPSIPGLSWNRGQQDTGRSLRGTQNPILPHPPLGQAWFDPPAREFVPYAPKACAAIPAPAGSGLVVKLVPVSSP